MRSKSGGQKWSYVRNPFNTFCGQAVLVHLTYAPFYSCKETIKVYCTLPTYDQMYIFYQTDTNTLEAEEQGGGEGEEEGHHHETVLLYA